MPIRVSCDHCGRPYKVKTKLAGQRFRCKDCDCVILIPTREADQADTESHDNIEPVGELTLSESLPTGTGVGLPPTATSKSTYPVSLRSRSNFFPIRKKLRWKTFLVSTAALVIVAAIATYRANTGEQNSDTKQNTANASSKEASSEDEFTEIQDLVDEQLKPENLTLSLADVVEEVRQKDAEQNLPWREFSFPDQPISILMPGNPTPLNRKQGAITIRGAALNSRAATGGKYGVMFINYNFPRGETFDIDRHFEETKSGMLEGVPFGRLTGERTISITDEGGNVHPGRQLEIEGVVFNKDMKYVYRTYMVGTQMIVSFTGVETEYAVEFEPNSTKFLDSLSITASIPPFNPQAPSEKPLPPANSNGESDKSAAN